jgi:hypothetical protein
MAVMFTKKIETIEPATVEISDEVKIDEEEYQEHYRKQRVTTKDSII